MRDHRGMFFSKRASGSEDELYYGVADASDTMQLRRILTTTYADTLYSATGHTHVGGASIVVQEGDVNVDTAVTTLDFDASDFNVTSSPSGEANIALAYGTSAGTPAEGNHTHTATLDTNYQGVTQETATAVLNFTSWQDVVTGSGGTATIGKRWLHPMQGTFKQDCAIPGGTTFNGMGMTALTVAATASNVDTTDGAWVRSTTAGTSGSAAGFTGHSSGNMRYDWAPSVVFVVKTDSTGTSIREHVGLYSGDPSASADPALHLMGFRHDTGAGDSNWMYGVNDNSGTGTWASTGIAYATGTVYRLGIHVDPSSGDIQFLISTGSNADSWSLVGTVASGAANTPGTTAALTRYARVTTLTNAARHINLSRITHYHER
jgi:hypothetical protein